MNEHSISNENYISSKVLLDNLDPRLESYYETRIKDTEFSNYFYEKMSPWLLTKIENNFTSEVTLFNIVYFVFETIVSQYGDSTAAYKAYYENNRSRKNYFFKVIKEEYEGKAKVQNPCYLHAQADTYFNLLPFDTTLKIYASKQEYMDLLYAQIQGWKKQRSSRLIEFMYFEKMSEKRRYESYICDVGLNLLEIVTQSYYGNYYGGLTAIPKPFIENSIFSYRSSSVPLSIKIEEDRAVASNSFTYTDADNNFHVVDIVMDEYAGNFESYITDEEKTSLIHKLRVDGALKTSADDLNPRDESVLSTVYSSFNVSVLTEDWIRIPARTFAAQVLGKTNLRARDIKGVLQSLEKLAHTHIRTEQRDADTNQLKGRGILSFFDVRYGVHDDGNNVITANLSIPGNTGCVTYSDELSDEDLASGKVDIEIAPSVFLKEMWRARVNTEIYTNQYQAITNTRTKAIMMLLQSERLKQYPLNNLTLTYAMLKTRLRMTEKTARMRKELAVQLDILKEEHIIVKEYSFTNTALYIEFLPFTDLEQLLYKVDSQKMISALSEDDFSSL